MTVTDIITSRRRALSVIVAASRGQAAHVDAWIARLAQANPRAGILEPPIDASLSYDATREDLAYQGFPRLAAFGFGIGSQHIGSERTQDFVDALLRLRDSGPMRVHSFAGDDVALLGVIDGLAQLLTIPSARDEVIAKHTQGERIHQLNEARSWMLSLINGRPPQQVWTSRLCALAGDLLDGRGRLKVTPTDEDIDAQILDIALRAVWPATYAQVASVLHLQQEQLLDVLLSAEIPSSGDAERAAVWLCALSTLLTEAIHVAMGDVDAASTQKESNGSMPTFQIESPIVFISYTHDSPEHKAQVRNLNDRLRQDGVQCILDQYEESPSQGWPRWMERQLEQAKYVLVICTQIYYHRVRGEEVPRKGLGAIWESGLITQEMYEGQGNNTKFIPVVFGSADIPYIPSMLRATTHYNLSLPDEYLRLLARLTNQRILRQPQVGPVRLLSPKATESN